MGASHWGNGWGTGDWGAWGYNAVPCMYGGWGDGMGGPPPKGGGVMGPSKGGWGGPMSGPPKGMMKGSVSRLGGPGNAGQKAGLVPGGTSSSAPQKAKGGGAALCGNTGGKRGAAKGDDDEEG